MVGQRNFQSVIGPLNRGSTPLKQNFIKFFEFKLNWARSSRSGAVVQRRNFQSVGFYTLKAAFYFIFFIFRFNWVLMSRSGATVQHKYF